MKSTLSRRFWYALTLFSLMGQVAWVVENMYFNVFIYKIFHASAADISLMVSASAVAATLTTVFMGALSDRVGKRKLFICGGYILWGISILSFSLIRMDIISALFPAVTSAAAVGISLVIIMDCVMTFFGSTANDAAFNAWLTDSTDASNRGMAEGVNAMMPLVAILVVFGGFMGFDQNLPQSWTIIFLIIGAVVMFIGILGFFIISEPAIKPDTNPYFSTILYGFKPSTISKNTSLYIALAAFILFNIAIQIFMPYLIIYYEVSLGMADYVFIMAPAIILASAVTALWGKVYDKKGFAFASPITLIWLSLGLVLLYFCRTTLPVFLGSFLMMSGYLAGMAVFGAIIRDNTPKGKSGALQGVRIFSQVLVPGVIGPMIGKWVLADAKTIVGGDGTTSFVPNANIFAVAIIPLCLLLPLLIILSKKPPRLCDLKTPYTPSETPFEEEHPRPLCKREAYTSLNGEWQLRILKKDEVRFEGQIKVPFPPESALSGVGRLTKKGEVLLYERTFTLSELHATLLLHFGAVDCECAVFINGTEVGTHQGGYLPFSFDITQHVKVGENHIKVRVSDNLSPLYPYGKQRYRRGGMWYTPTSGIWQTVWLEMLPALYIEDIKISTTLTSVTIKTKGGAPEKEVCLCDKTYTYVGDEVTITVDSPLLWTPETPHIYPFTLLCGEDKISSYFALREIGTAEVNGTTYLTLNGKPYFFHGLLDQGYFADGIYLPGNAEGYKEDILRAKEMGFNMLRKHIKIEPDIFYYYCDIYGMAVFQDMVNSGRYSFLLDTALPTLGIKKGLVRKASKKRQAIWQETAEQTVACLYSHPSVVYYTIFNEGWGQHNATPLYRHLKALDASRIWDTASGWFSGVESDVESEHVYFKPVSLTPKKDKPLVLSEFGGYSYKMPDHSFNLDKTYGYRKCPDQDAFMRDLETLYFGEIVPMIKKGLCATVLTQLSDVEDETNGLLTYDRQIVKADTSRMKDIGAVLASTFFDTVSQK